jgi:tetratricopeptide (TPR) repeat protein
VRLEQIVDKLNDRVGCLQVLAGIARAARDEPRLNAALNEIVHAGCADEKACLGNLVWVAQAHEASGSLRQALATYRRAYERAPEDDTLLENMARLAGATGMNAEALRDYQELGRRHPDDGKWRKAAEEQHDALARGMVKL